ncbi:MAG: T9SS type A sorting domain-containing protein [Flammeovirgaceae bacterium]
MRGDVITDPTGNVYISSVTGSTNFPIVNGFDNSFNGGTTDGLVVKLSPDLSSIIWSSYVGGAGLDAAYSIKFDNSPTEKSITIFPAKNLIGSTFSMYDNTGKQVVNGELIDYTIDLSILSPGIYMLKIDGEKPLKIVKF